MKRTRTLFNREWPRRFVTVTTVALVATCVLFGTNAFADAGNPILGTIHGVVVPDDPAHPEGGVTVYVRGQWNWFSHNSDCNFDRAATGVGMVWNDPQFPDGNSNDPNDPRSAKDEVQRITIAGTIQPAGTIRLKFNAKETTNIQVGNNATSADNIQAALNALSTIGGVSGSVAVALTTATATSHTWNVTFGGSLGSTDVTAIQVSNRTNAGSGASVTELTKGRAQVFNGWPLEGYYVGTQSATSQNPVDRMVHPVDRGNRVEGYTSGTWTSTGQGYTTNTPGDWPQGQQFIDPSPPGITATQVAAWKGGCGREPLSATASKATPGPDMEPTGLSCADGTTACANRPWGSWGYEKNSGRGYSHHFARRSDLTIVCANFYDVHGGGKSNSNSFQLVNGTKEITVDANGDNSIETNEFDITQGANCFSFDLHTPALVTNASGPITIGEGSISDTATISNLVSPDGSGSITFTAYAPLADGSADPNCTTPVHTSTASGVNANGDYSSGSFTPSGTAPQIAGTYQWIASFSGDAGNAAVQGQCGDEGEQSLVRKHSTQLPTRQTILISDYARVTASAGTPTGNVVFQLFSTAGCTGTPIYDSGQVPLVNGVAGTTASPNLELDDNGTYSWLVTYSGNLGSAVSPCGSESTTIQGNDPNISP